MESIYFDKFSCREDVESDFNVKLESDCEILLAVYRIGDYEGDALVIERRVKSSSW